MHNHGLRKLGAASCLAGRGTQYIRGLCGVVLLCAAFNIAAGAALADWIDLSPKEMAEQSDLIVLGELTGRSSHQITGSPNIQNIGTVQVTEVLKGENSTKTLKIELAPTRPNGLVSSADLRFEDGQAGLWYLQKSATAGLYLVDRPDRFIPTQDADDRIRALLK